jgi:membrane protein DedA with SNARE-associated domain
MDGWTSGDSLFLLTVFPIMPLMEEFLQEWGYLGVFLGILATGIPFLPIPEELPVVIGGVLAGHNSVYWWLMLPVCIVAVVIGDGMLYGVGRCFGPRILKNAWIQKYVLPPERLEKIEGNFQKHGIKILLFARLTPGIRAPIFMTAGILRLSLPLFILADGLYAIPGVCLLFFLGYWFTEGIINLIETNMAHVRSIIIMVVILAIAGYFVYRFLRKPVVTGSPEEVPPLVEQVTHTIGQVTHKLEDMTTKIIHPRRKSPCADKTVRIEPGPNGPAPEPTHPPKESHQPKESGPASS